MLSPGILRTRRRFGGDRRTLRWLRRVLPLPLFAAAVAAAAQDSPDRECTDGLGRVPGLWPATGHAEYLAGTERQIRELGFTLPLWQDLDSLLFLDFRGRTDDSEADELNLGLASRTLLDGKWILGAYGFYDRSRSAHGNDFDQLALGVELLSRLWDFRVNGYLPEDEGKPSPGTARVSFAGSRIFLTGAEERPCYGLDYEVGRRLLAFGEREHEVRAFAGGYYFDSDAAGYAHLAGPRGRLELRLFDPWPLPAGSRLTLSAEVQWDEVRGTQGFAGLHVQVPLGGDGVGPGSGRASGETAASGALAALERRMLDPIVRDVDVVTQTSGRELARAAAGGPAVLANRDNPLENAVNMAGPGGTVVVFGPVATAGLVKLKNGQRITGGRETVRLRGEHSGLELTARLPDLPGMVIGTHSRNPVMLLTDEVTVDHLQIRGGAIALSSDSSLAGVSLVHNVISGHGSGIHVDRDFRGVIAGNRIHGTHGPCISIRSNSGLISGNVLAQSSTGMFLNFNTADGRVAGNRAVGNGRGFNIWYNRGTVERNAAIANRTYGFSLDSSPSGDGSFTNNLAAGNQQDGFVFWNGNSGIVRGNTATGNGAAGFSFQVHHVAVGRERNVANTGEVHENAAIANGTDGFQFKGTNYGDIANNLARDNQRDGFTGFPSFPGLPDFVFLNRGAFRDNTASDNGGRGYRVATTAPGTQSGNTGSGNAAGGDTP